MFNSSPLTAAQSAEEVKTGAAATPAAGAGARPRHVAIIMDGNGRWAKARGLPRLAGHRRGAETVRRIVEAAPDLGVEWLTLSAFSTENWKRSAEEVTGLMELFAIYIRREGRELKRRGARVRFIGERGRLAPDLAAAMARLEAETAENGKLNLTIAINYGGRDEIAAAARRLAEDVAAGRLDPACVDASALESRLATHGFPDPDLVIRTSGEMRTSNFLPWQTAYSEFAFVDDYWPDFSVERFGEALASFGARQRRFGAVG